jgi:hypothetical protein
MTMVLMSYVTMTFVILPRCTWRPALDVTAWPSRVPTAKRGYGTVRR